MLLAPTLFAAQVTLKNGDTITCTIVKKDGDKLTVKSEFLGEVTMPWSAVTSVKSDEPVYVALPGDKQVTGKLETEGSNLKVQSEAIPLKDVAAIRNADEEKKYERLLKPRWKELWTGHLDLGFSLARGNARTDTFTSGFAADRITRNDKTSLNFNQIYSTAVIDGAKGITADAIHSGWSYDHNLNAHWFFNTFNTYEFDKFQNLDLRYIAGGGVGIHALKTERTTLDFLVGGDYAHESFSNNLHRSLGEIYGGDDLKRKISSSSSITQSFRIFESPSASEHRFIFDLGANTVLRKWLSWQVTASDRYLSNPDPGHRKNDVLLTTGFRVSFSR